MLSKSWLQKWRNWCKSGHSFEKLVPQPTRLPALTLQTELFTVRKHDAPAKTRLHHILLARHPDTVQSIAAS